MERAEVVISAYQDMIQEQLDEGLRAIQHSANTLMHEIAAEVWRTAGADKESVASTILQELSRDQAIGALISHTDERFQALAARTARLEDTMNMLAESVRSAREDIARSADTLAESGGAQLGVGQIRAHLDEVSHQVTAAFRTLTDRDRAIVDAVHERIREHGELISQEATRISEAMQEYVQQGVAAMGRLAESADSQMQAISAQGMTGDRLLETVERRVSELAEQLQLLYDRTAIAMTSLHESVSFLGDRMGIETRDRLTEMTQAFEARVFGMAELVRSDSEALQRELVRTAEAHDEHLAEALDERLTRATDQIVGDLSATLQARLDERLTRATDQIVGDLSATLQARLEDAMTKLAEGTAEQARRIDARTAETVSAIDRNLIRMVDSLEDHFERLGVGVGDRAASAADLAIGARFDDVLARLHEAVSLLEREGSQTRSAVAESRGALEEVRSSFDQRFVALAKLVRADSETLAGQISADQDVTKQALRAMKELQASLPTEVTQMVEERFVSLAESIERSNEMLAARMDRMAQTIGQRQNDDIQIVIDRMGDAMHALAGLGKGSPGAAAASESRSRIKID